MKRFFRRSKYDVSSFEEENTLENILRLKKEEKGKIEAEEKEFQKQRRERERKLIIIEEEELNKRETERDYKMAELETLKYQNQLVVDKYEEQMKILRNKLEEVQEDQFVKEKLLEKNIGRMNEEIEVLRGSLANRIKKYGEDGGEISGLPERTSLSSLESSPMNSRAPSAPPPYSSEAFGYPSLENLAEEQTKEEEDDNISVRTLQPSVEKRKEDFSSPSPSMESPD